MTGIYKIENLINHKVYIGQATNIDTRWLNHKKGLSKNTHINNHLQSAWNKYGEENFKFAIVEECEEDKLTEREQYWIDYYGGINCNNTYNYKDAVKGGHLNNYLKQKISASNKVAFQKIETKEKLRLARLGTKLSDETKEKIRQVHLGKLLSEEHKRKISIANTGKHIILSEETKQKIGQSHKGIPASDLQRKTASEVLKLRWQNGDWREKISNINKGNSYCKGYKHTDEEKEKIRQASLNRIFSEDAKQKISKALKNKPKSKEHKEKLGKIIKGRIWINDTKISKMIYPEQLNEFIILGFTIGRLKFKKGDG